MINNQPQMPTHYDPDGIVRIHSVFKTIQGEGPFCGERALFIRLYGCNLRCPGCDTEYTAAQAAHSPTGVVELALKNNWPQGALVVITGGEPFRQNIGPMVRCLIAAGYPVQVETNGITYSPDMPHVYSAHKPNLSAQPLALGLSIVCSPKTPRIHQAVWDKALAFKYILQAGDVNFEDGLPLHALGHSCAFPGPARPRRGALVYVQPMDEQDEAANARNLAACIQSVERFGYRLQLQTHKIIGME